MYCVDVVSSTSSATLHSECGIIETEYLSPVRVGCDEFDFTVTPVNLVGNGTSSDIFYRFPAGIDIIVDKFLYECSH